MATGSLSLVAESRRYFLSCSVQSSHCDDFSCCGVRALGTRASVIGTCWLYRIQ